MILEMLSKCSLDCLAINYLILTFQHKLMSLNETAFVPAEWSSFEVIWSISSSTKPFSLLDKVVPWPYSLSCCSRFSSFGNCCQEACTSTAWCRARSPVDIRISNTMSEIVTMVARSVWMYFKASWNHSHSFDRVQLLSEWWASEKWSGLYVFYSMELMVKCFPQNGQAKIMIWYCLT